MKLTLLNRNQIELIYNVKMIYDFPPLELKPLHIILSAYDSGVYICYALVEDSYVEDDTDADSILGYAFFVKRDNDYLFDFLAVSKEMRNRGLGAKFLDLIGQKFADSDSVIGEVEDPDYAETDELRGLQERRMNFYIRNGYINTGIKIELYNVNYIVFEMNLGKNHDRADVARLYETHYRALLPEDIFKDKFRMKN